MAHFVRIATGRVIDIARVFDAEWVGEEGKPELQLWIAGAQFDPGRKAGGLGPWTITLEGDEANAAWHALTAAARRQAELCPVPAVTLEPFTLDEGEPPAGTSYRAGEAEVFLDARDDRAEPEVFGPWAGAVPLSRFLETARAVETIARDVRFMDRVHAPAPAALACAAD